MLGLHICYKWPTSHSGKLNTSHSLNDLLEPRMHCSFSILVGCLVGTSSVHSGGWRSEVGLVVKHIHSGCRLLVLVWD